VFFKLNLEKKMNRPLKRRAAAPGLLLQTAAEGSRHPPLVEPPATVSNEPPFETASNHATVICNGSSDLHRCKRQQWSSFENL
jgi:hypothetical protein